MPAPDSREGRPPSEASEPARLRIGIVGFGPTALYLLKELLSDERPYDIVIFEAGRTAGPGIPFDRRRNGKAMLANIAGVELPPVTETLTAWALRQPAERLEEWGIAAQAGDERAFFPRVVLGAYFAEQYARLTGRDLAPHRLTVMTRTYVTDILAAAEDVTLRWTRHAESGEMRCDRLVIATGYAAPRRRDSLPQPGTEPSREDARRIGIIGSSLSAIDVAVSLALRRGRFTGRGGKLRYESDGDWRATMLSRHGLLPEAEFWAPIPYEPLDIFTEAAVGRLVTGQDGDLDLVFALFREQLRAVAPERARELRLDRLDADSFAESHFAERASHDPFAWSARVLKQARASYRARRPDPWRYAVLRMHEVFGTIVPRLSARDLARFESGLKRCFIDGYAGVPHLSVRRLLALHAAGALEAQTLAEGYAIAWQAQARLWRIQDGDTVLAFDDLIDARGQQALGLQQLPFPSLRRQLCAQARAEGRDTKDGLNPGEGYAVDAQDPALRRIHVLALPFLMKRRPFIQGLTESADIAQATASAIADAAGARCSPI